MSKKNITAIDKLDGGKVRITFDAADGPAVYEYSGSSARAVLRGTDPAHLMGGKRIKKEK